MDVSIKVDTKSVTKFLNNIADKQLAYASMNALNNTAFKVKDAEVAALSKHLDRPTPFTQRSYEVVKANKARLTATIQARAIQAGYLKLQVFGGSRSAKGKAIVIPAEVKRNSYGNMTKGAVKSLLASKTAFSGKVGGVGGIFKRRGRGKNQTIDLMVLYKPGASYSKRLPFFEVGQSEAAKILPGEFTKALAAAIGSAK